MNRTYEDRRRNRHYKAMRRIREDRAQHGSSHDCPCFDTSGRGIIFDGFADTPTRCSSWCCGNPRRHWGLVTVQEMRAPTTKDWDVPLHVPLQRTLE